MDYELMMNSNVKIGMKAPNFEAETTIGKISLSSYIGKWVLLFSYMGDFTPVCTTEILAFSNYDVYFKEKNTSLIGLSVDSLPSHLAWIYDIYLKTGIKISFPIIADGNGVIARKYGMISSDISNTQTVRNVYIIDPEGIIRLILVYPVNIGRCIPEIIRILDALQIADCNNCSTPANWTLENPIVKFEPHTFNELIQNDKFIQKNNSKISWYLEYENNKDYYQ